MKGLTPLRAAVLRALMRNRKTGTRWTGDLFGLEVDGKRPKTSTLIWLEREGLIEDLGLEHRITGAGRQALRESS